MQNVRGGGKAGRAEVQHSTHVCMEKAKGRGVLSTSVLSDVSTEWKLLMKNAQEVKILAHLFESGAVKMLIYV